MKGIDDQKTLGDALPEQIARVQGIITIYRSVPNGQFAAALMQQDIDTAQKAMIKGDLPGMIAAYESLSEWKED
ncbi:hypothetical protein [Oscillibacter sp.]|uniref:hypothetical protein n=1 Tax=Oscillibacter sp. TaxID=1945593 RepID=UPI0028B2152A|nr:hypothetical protein [Oscillibacter sp.]